MTETFAAVCAVSCSCNDLRSGAASFGAGLSLLSNSGSTSQREAQSLCLGH